MIKLKKIKVNYGEKNILNNISLDIKKNDKISIVGKSGSGKSTILKTIAGIINPDQGVIMRKKNINIGFLFQENCLLPWKTVKENIKFFNKNINEEEITELLQSLEIEKAINLHPQMLSGGMLKRANLAISISKKPEIILMDEPFSSLDYITKIKNYHFIKKIINENIFTSILVTHDINEAIFFSKKVYILSNKNGNFTSCINIKEDVSSLKDCSSYGT